MIISKKAVDFIVSCEVTSRAHYEKRLFGLSWPGGDSGVTIGIGYDLGFNSPQSIEHDWIKEIGGYQVGILKMFSGLKGEKAHSAKATNKMSPMVNIPYTAAYNVFVRVSLPRYARQALSVYPGLDELTPDATGAIVSMVYNRGTLLTGDRRAEMKAIAPLVVAKDYEGIAFQIDKSKRLWTNGLVQRREQEAAMVKGSLRQYGQDELITI